MKKTIALLLSLLMVFSLAACGSSDTTTDDTPAQKAVVRLVTLMPDGCRHREALVG